MKKRIMKTFYWLCDRKKVVTESEARSMMNAGLCSGEVIYIGDYHDAGLAVTRAREKGLEC